MQANYALCRRAITGVATIACLGFFVPIAAAARPHSPLPTNVVELANFESPNAAARWTGLNCQRTDQHASRGEFGLQFTIPRWTGKGEPRPGIRLPCGTEAQPLRDFSPFGAIAVDVWVDGDQPGQLGLKLRDQKGEDSWTTHIVVAPHRWNTAKLAIDDAAADCDVHHVQDVVLYALRPTNRFTLVVDNLRLLPRPKPPLAQFHLRQPNYRRWIFPGARRVAVDVSVAPAAHGFKLSQLAVELTLTDAGRRRSSQQPLRTAMTRAHISAAGLPAGPVTLVAQVYRRGSGAELARHTWLLRQLNHADVAKLRVYVDAHQRLIVGGKPFFPLGWYGSVNEQQLAEIADSPFNCLLAYGTDLVPKARMLRFLDTMQADGLKLIYCLNDVYPTATYLKGKSWEGVTGNAAIAGAVVRAYRDHPAVLAWYLNDELPRKLVPQLGDYYRRVKAGDPTRPCFIVLCNRSELPYFPATTDIMGVDPYPIPKDPITRVSGFVDAARAAVRNTKPVWLVPQAFAWYQYNSKNPNRGHIPTPEELKTGRAPTYAEERCMTYLGLVHGAKGLIYYCYYDLRVLPQYKQMWGWMKSIAAEVKSLSPVLLSTQNAGQFHLSPGTPVHAALKRRGNRLYLLAVNPSASSCRIEFDLQRPLTGRVKVRFEHRSLQARDGRFADEFAPLAVHVYALRGSGKP